MRGFNLVEIKNIKIKKMQEMFLKETSFVDSFNDCQKLH